VTPRHSPLRSIPRLAAFLIMTVVLILAYALAVMVADAWARRVQILWSQLSLGLTGLKVRVIGERSAERPTVFAVNHLSYLDIPVLSSLIDARFVAKSEVANWPMFGVIAKVTRTVFVSRVSSQAAAQSRVVMDTLQAGHNLILFPEGTSTDGSGVEPFKSSLFAFGRGDGPEVQVQPVSVAYTRALDGTPLVGPLRSLYCWFGDATLAPHLVRLLGYRGAEVEVRFHPPVPTAAFADRKELARHCQEAVAAGVEAAHSGASAEEGNRSRAAE